MALSAAEAISSEDTFNQFKWNEAKKHIAALGIQEREEWFIRVARSHLNSLDSSRDLGADVAFDEHDFANLARSLGVSCELYKNGDYQHHALEDFRVKGQGSDEFRVLTLKMYQHKTQTDGQIEFEATPEQASEHAKVYGGLKLKLERKEAHEKAKTSRKQKAKRKQEEKPSMFGGAF